MKKSLPEGWISLEHSRNVCCIHSYFHQLRADMEVVIFVIYLKMWFNIWTGAARGVLLYGKGVKFRSWRATGSAGICGFVSVCSQLIVWFAKTPFYHFQN